MDLRDYIVGVERAGALRVVAGADWNLYGHSWHQGRLAPTGRLRQVFYRCLGGTAVCGGHAKQAAMSSPEGAYDGRFTIIVDDDITGTKVL